MTYQEVRPWARSIKTRVVAREMPPWHVDARSASRSSRTIRRSATKRSPPSSSGSTPARRRATRPTCRRRAHSPRLATGRSASRIWSSSSRPTRCRRPARICSATCYADIPIDEDRYIKAHPDPLGDRRSRTRSCTTRCRTRSSTPRGRAWRRWRGQFLVEYASGKNAEVYPEGSGVLLKDGQQARLSYHMHSIGEEIDAEVETGHGALPQGLRAEAHPLVAAARAADDAARHPGRHRARSDGYTILHKPARLIAFQPHMHNLGKRQCLEVIYPTSGTRTTTEMINCANFNNNWHLTYNYADDAQPLVPAGTILHNIQWHDNSPDQSARARPEELGRRRPAHDRRDGLLLDRLGRADRRGIQDAARRAQSRSSSTDAAPARSSNSSSRTAMASASRA